MAYITNKNAGGKEVPKGLVHIIVELVDYSPDSVISKTILKKSSGNVTAMSFAKGEELGDKSSPFDIYIQIIDGEAELVMNQRHFQLPVGSGIVIPANTTHAFNANQKFKMITTVIKSGYKELSLNPI